MPGALAGLSVLDFTSQLSGPYCSMILADLGADVVKVERPGQGDESRAMGPHVAGESAPFMTFNRNKRSITIDLKTADGGAIARRLATRADVVLENWRPGTAARLGLGWDDVHALNARAIYCSISGFGQTGPYAQRGGFDRIAQGMSGMMSINGTEEGPPLPVPIPVSDIGTGMFAAIGILAALRVREQTAVGQRVDTSLLETPIAWAVYEASSFFATNEVPRRLGPGHRTAAPYSSVSHRRRLDQSGRWLADVLADHLSCAGRARARRGHALRDTSAPRQEPGSARGPPRNEVHHRGDGGVAGATRGRRRAGGADPRLRPGLRGSPRASPRDGRRGRAPARGAIACARNPREALEHTGKHPETGAHARAAHRRGVEGAGLRRRGRGEPQSEEHRLVPELLVEDLANEPVERNRIEAGIG